MRATSDRSKSVRYVDEGRIPAIPSTAVRSHAFLVFFAKSIDEFVDPLGGGDQKLHVARDQ